MGGDEQRGEALVQEVIQGPRLRKSLTLSTGVVRTLSPPPSREDSRQVHVGRLMTRPKGPLLLRRKTRCRELSRVATPNCKEPGERSVLCVWGEGKMGFGGWMGCLCPILSKPQFPHL